MVVGNCSLSKFIIGNKNRVTDGEIQGEEKRYGGEEFVAIFPDTPMEGAERIADALRQHVQDLQLKHDYATDAKCVTISIGIACMIPHAESSAEALLKVADDSLYVAKREGRNRIHSNTLPPSNYS